MPSPCPHLRHHPGQVLLWRNQRGCLRQDHKTRLHPGRKTGTEGLGLGLAIVRRLIEAMGGTLVAQSAAGQGASFRFTLPVAGTLASFSGRPSVS